MKSPGQINSGFAIVQIQRAHGTLIVVTLYAGNVSVSDEPLTAIVPMDTGVTGLPAVLCVEAVAAVIWYILAVPDRLSPLIAATCVVFARLMATNTTRPGVVLSVLT